MAEPLTRALGLLGTRGPAVCWAAPAMAGGGATAGRDRGRPMAAIAVDGLADRRTRAARGSAAADLGSAAATLRTLADRFGPDRAIRLEARDDLCRDRPAEEPLDIPQERRLVDADE